MNTEAQLLVYIDSDLKKEAQIRAVKDDISLKVLVSQALTKYLSKVKKDEDF